VVERARELLWLVDHLDDVLSDLSAVHRFRRDEALALSAGEFFPLAERLVHYPGVVRDLVTTEIRKNSASGPTPHQVQQDILPITQVHEPTEAEVQAMRDQRRRQRFGGEFGEHRRVPLDKALSGVSADD